MENNPDKILIYKKDRILEISIEMKEDITRSVLLDLINLIKAVEE